MEIRKETSRATAAFLGVCLLAGGMTADMPESEASSTTASMTPFAILMIDARKEKERKKEREKEKKAAVEDVILSPTYARINAAIDKGADPFAMSHAAACQSQVNPGSAVKEREQITGLMFADFYNCVNAASLIARASASDVKAAQHLGYDASQAKHLPQCQAAHGIKAGDALNITFQQAQRADDCVKDASKQAFMLTYFYPTLIGMGLLGGVLSRKFRP